MPLIACPDCGRHVSERAPACPECGGPIAAQTIEATGKRYKALQAIGAAVLLLGTLSCVVAPENSRYVLLQLVGLVLFVGARIGAWWDHG